MSGERDEARRRGKGGKPLWRTMRVPLALASVTGGAVLTASRFLPGTVIGWQAFLENRAGRTLPLVLVLLVAGYGLFLAARRRPGTSRASYPAPIHILQASRHRALRAAIFGAADLASAAGGTGLQSLLDWSISVAKIILLVGALGLVLRLMYFCESFAAAGEAGSPESVVFLGSSLYPLAVALAVAIPIVGVGLLLKRRGNVALAQARAVARALAGRAGGKRR